MLTATGCRARRQRLWDRLPDKPDWIILSDPSSLIYFANYYPSPFVFRSNDAAALLILGADGSSTLIADNLLEPFAAAAHVDRLETPIWYRGVESAPPRAAFLMQNAVDILAKRPARTFGIEPSHLPAPIFNAMNQRPGAKFTDIEPHIRELRRQKDSDELELLRRSMRAGEAGMASVMRDLRPGMTEIDAYLIVQREAWEVTGEQALIYGDFVSGARCEAIGGPPSRREIEPGDLVLLDFSTVIHGYRADFANTFLCGGRPTGRQRELYQACVDAITAGEKLLRPGVPAREVDRAVRGSFAARGLEKNFPSHSGHGIGLGHPEPPFLVPESSDTLMAGDVVTLEPGQYIKGVAGMRYERNYLITETGFELLSHHAIAIDAE